MQMDTSKPQKVKTRKTKVVVTRKSTAQILSSLFFRTIEITVVIVTVAKLFNQIVVTVENHGEHFKGLSSVLSNRHLAFITGNAIVIALLAKSGRFPYQESRTRNDFYEEFVRESRREEGNSSCDQTRNRVKGTTEITTGQSVAVEKQRQAMRDNDGGVTENTVENRPRKNSGENRTRRRKSYARNRSENLEHGKISRRKLKRSETEWFLDSVDSEERTRDMSEEMSDDELQFKIESFIARQRRNHQTDEEFCIT
ncbi:PREDICTED: uncharacterized protein LOC104824815 [Tarenaya hassleriana]|uniref:uncharacterized protein LOC104824815 n=1 Tax=Tarenaya hassleriana TaxID=28532 RepID=UPI00053C9295|nr:PREDICTED: uncharacterized protein LOC104824815 [Tarenaya hassleriana]